MPKTKGAQGKNKKEIPIKEKKKHGRPARQNQHRSFDGFVNSKRKISRTIIAKIVLTFAFEETESDGHRICSSN